MVYFLEEEIAISIILTMGMSVLLAVAFSCPLIEKKVYVCGSLLTNGKDYF